jgi:hypothetical protein
MATQEAATASRRSHKTSAHAVGGEHEQIRGVEKQVGFHGRLGRSLRLLFSLGRRCLFMTHYSFDKDRIDEAPAVIGRTGDTRVRPSAPRFRRLPFADAPDERPVEGRQLLGGATGALAQYGCSVGRPSPLHDSIPPSITTGSRQPAPRSRPAARLARSRPSQTRNNGRELRNPRSCTMRAACRSESGMEARRGCAPARMPLVAAHRSTRPLRVFRSGRQKCADLSWSSVLPPFTTFVRNCECEPRTKVRSATRAELCRPIPIR